jgi:Probable zinc-ribbon domain
MKSNRQRREEIGARRAQKRAVAARAQAVLGRARFSPGKVRVKPEKLAPSNSYGTPEFVRRGYYEDQPFRCKDCGKGEVWTATQQKWWYEVAQGDVWTTAIRCRACRRKEAARRAEARKVHQEGIARRGGNGRPPATGK